MSLRGIGGSAVLSTAIGTLGFSSGGTNKTTLQYVAPATGATVTVAATDRFVVIKPAGTIAELTVTLPTAAQSANGDQITVNCTQIVTTLTVAAGAGASVANAPVAFAAGGFMSFVYRTADTTFYRCG